MVPLIGAKKACDKIQPAFMTKTLSKLEIERNFLNLIEGSICITIYNICLSIYLNPTANVFHHKRQNSFSLRLGKRQGCSLTPLLLNIILEVLASVIKQEKSKSHADWEGRNKTASI